MAHIKKLEYDVNMDNAKNSDILAMGIFEDKNDSELINSQMKGKVGELAFRGDTFRRETADVWGGHTPVARRANRIPSVFVHDFHFDHPKRQV